jgi:hypothetical protein
MKKKRLDQGYNVNLKNDTMVPFESKAARYNCNNTTQRQLV